MNHPAALIRNRMPGTGLILASLLLFGIAKPSSAGKRCDLLVAATPVAGGNAACLDLLAMKANPGAAVKTALNATRIGRDGITLCKNAFQAASGAEADIVFIYDNSGSMTANFAFADPARGDTAFYFATEGCASPGTQGLLSLPTAEGPREIPLLVSDAGCMDRSGDPYNARAAAMRQAIDFLGKTSPHSTGAAVGFTDVLLHPQPPLVLDNPAALAQVKNSMVPDTTGGTRYGPPLRQVMEEIIRSITVTALPRSIKIVNTSLAPNQTSVSVKMSATPVNGDIHVTLDSILALKQGANAITVQVDPGSATGKSYSFQVQADGPEAAQSAAGLACFEQPTLAMLNPAGRMDSAYAAGPAAYDVLLTRSPSELGNVTVTAITSDSTKDKSWGDAEAILMPVTALNAGAVTSRRNGLPTHGSAVHPVANNGVLEGSSSGKMVLTWTHPRDPREAATFLLPSARIPTVPGFIEVERVMAVSRGAEIQGRIADPVVILGGVTLNRIGTDSAVVASRGCLYNCVGEAMRAADPARTPSFIFKTASPFGFTLHVYDNLGHILLKASGAVKASDWESMPRIGDSVAVAMSIIPRTSDGRPAATGAYILRATISTTDLERAGANGPSRVTASNRTFINTFGYVRTAHP